MLPKSHVGFGFQLFFLFVVGRIGNIVHSVFEGFDTFAQSAHKFGYFASTEEEEHYEGYNENFLHPETQEARNHANNVHEK
mgnify:FL=1|jgi:hypothetical protein